MYDTKDDVRFALVSKIELPKGNHLVVEVRTYRKAPFKVAILESYPAEGRTGYNAKLSRMAGDTATKLGEALALAGRIVARYSPTDAPPELPEGRTWAEYITANAGGLP